MPIERVPPNDPDAEIACIASALLSRDALFKVIEILQPEDFYVDKHRLVFESVMDLEKKGLPIDLTTLKQRLNDRGVYERMGGDSALVEIYQAVSTSANAHVYAGRVKELSLRRKLIDVSSDAIEKCYDRSVETPELMDDVEKNIFSVTEMRITNDFKSLENVLKDTMDSISSWYETKRVVTGIGSGFRNLDEMLTGFHGSELIVMAARPGMGKTALALNIMNHIGLKEKKPVLFFSLEMPAVQLGMRMLCIESMINSQQVRTGHISSEQLKNLFQTSGRLSRAQIYIDDTPSINILEMRAKARRMQQKHQLGAIIVDYLQLISSVSRVDRHLQIAEISRFLKQLARELSVPVIALSQLSRTVEQRADQRPTLSDLRESGAIEQDADVVIFIYREEKVKKDSERKGEADLIIAKQRNGPTGTVALKFWEEYTKFSDLIRIDTYDEASPNHEFN